MKLRASDLHPGQAAKTLTAQGFETVELWSHGPTPGTWWAIFNDDRHDVRTVTIASLYTNNTTLESVRQ